jgi:hypothetical protein
MRPLVARIAAVGSFALVAVLGTLLGTAAVADEGISIGGNVCGGGGSAQRCLYVDRFLTVAWDLGWFSAAALLTAVGLVGVGVAGAAVPSLRPWLATAAALLAVVGLVGVEHVEGRFCPGSPRATCGSDMAWGPVLRPPLLELGAEQTQAHLGRPVVPGGPVADPGRILETFRASAATGWTWVRRLVVAVWFLALAQLAAMLARPLWAAVLGVVTVGGFVWAAVADAMYPCAKGASDCYRGLLTGFAFMASTVLWVIALAVAGIVSVVRRRLRSSA